MSLLNTAEQYFSNMNTMAARMYADFEDTRNSYECVWKTLSPEEQSQILNERIIKPEVTLQYIQSASNRSSDVSFAQKQVVDDNMSYRDEHSAPFSFKTASQIDLRMFDCDNNRKLYSTPKIQAPKPQPKVVTPVVEAPATRYKTDTSIFGKFLGRRQSPDSEQEILMSPDAASTSTTSTLPKTGLDFLDNW